MLDANQRWEVNEAISWVKELVVFKPLWIEEPTSPDDILGHATISKVYLCLKILYGYASNYSLTEPTLYYVSSLYITCILPSIVLYYVSSPYIGLNFKIHLQCSIKT